MGNGNEDTEQKKRTRAEEFISKIKSKGYITDNDVKEELSFVAENIAYLNGEADNSFVLWRA